MGNIAQRNIHIGSRMGRLVIIGSERHTTPGGRNIIVYKCKCDCGRECFYQRASFLKGSVASCGCKKREVNQTHGLTHTRTYNIYHAMMQRCYDKSQLAYARYGGAGVIVCDRWRESFDNFLEDMGQCPSNRHSLDRIDTFGNYEPSNCRWATLSQQARNKRNTVKILYGGEMVSLSDIADRVGIGYTTLYMRIFSYGWPIEKAIHTPIDVRHHRKTMYGSSKQNRKEP